MECLTWWNVFSLSYSTASVFLSVCGSRGSSYLWCGNNVGFTCHLTVSLHRLHKCLSSPLESYQHLIIKLHIICDGTQIIYLWPGEIWSKKAGLSYGSLSLKVYETPNHCTVVYNIRFYNSGNLSQQQSSFNATIVKSTVEIWRKHDKVIDLECVLAHIRVVSAAPWQMM